jgi:probable F420-dependent oxidoreductase
MSEDPTPRRLTYAVSIRHSLATEPSGDFDANAYAEIISQVETLGYDDVLLADHVFVPPYWANIIGDIFFEPFTLFSYLAARTSRIGLTLACLVVPYRQPFATAKMVAAVDQLSRGRFALGVVPGYLKEEFKTFRLPRHERSDMTNEFVRIMIELWTQDTANYEGQYYSCEGVTIKPKCLQHPHVPIWVGGSSRNAMARVAAFGDVWHPLSFQPVDDAYFAAHEADFTNSMQTGGTTPELLRKGLQYIHDLTGPAGRDVTDLKVVVNAGARVHDGGGSGPSRRGGDEIALGGDRVVNWLGRYVEAGATGFSISPPGDSPEECVANLARFAEEVIPQLS